MTVAASRLLSAPPLRRAGAGAAGGFAAFVAIQVVLRAIHWLGPISDGGTLGLSLAYAGAWSLLVMVASAALRDVATRLVVLSLVPLFILAPVVFLNAPYVRGPHGMEIVRVPLVLALTLGWSTALLGNALEKSWSKHVEA